LIAAWRDGEGAGDTSLDRRFLQQGVRLESHYEFVVDAVGILLDKLEAIVPGRTVDIPMLVEGLQNAYQDALLVLAVMGAILQVDGHQDLEIKCCDFWHALGDGQAT
jgi:hypothetical protein